MGHGPHSSEIVALFYVLFVCKCVLYYCHWVTTQLQLTNTSYHKSSHVNTKYWEHRIKIRVPYEVENFSFWTTSSFSRRICASSWAVTKKVEDCFTTEPCTFGAQFPSNENALAVRHLARWHLDRLVVGVCRSTMLVRIISYCSGGDLYRSHGQPGSAHLSASKTDDVSMT